MTSAAATHSPIFAGAVLHIVPTPTRRRVWDFTVNLGNRAPSPIGGINQETRDTAEAHLFALADKYVTLTTRNGSQYVVKVDNVQQVQLVPAKDGPQQDQEQYKITCFALSPETKTVLWGIDAG
jgi:hypothetical protein